MSNFLNFWRRDRWTNNQLLTIYKNEVGIARTNNSLDMIWFDTRESLRLPFIQQKHYNQSNCNMSLLVQIKLPKQISTLNKVNMCPPLWCVLTTKFNLTIVLVVYMLPHASFWIRPVNKLLSSVFYLGQQVHKREVKIEAWPYPTKWRAEICAPKVLLNFEKPYPNFPSHKYQTSKKLKLPKNWLSNIQIITWATESCY